MHLTSGVCGVYYTFPGGPAFLKPRLHDTTCCQTGLITGCIVYTKHSTRLTTGLTKRLYLCIQPVVKPALQPDWQPVVLCKRGLMRYADVGYQPPLTHVIRTARLKFFSHTAHADPCRDYSRAIRACVAPLPRPIGLCCTVLCTPLPNMIYMCQSYRKPKVCRFWKTVLNLQMLLNATSLRLAVCQSVTAEFSLTDVPLKSLVFCGFAGLFD